MDQEIPFKTTVLDTLVQDRQLQMLKTALPYMNNSSQKSIAFLIKYMELQRTVSLFNSPQASLQICSVPESEEPRPLQMLEALRDFFTEKEQETIDTLINYMQMFSACETLFV